MNFVKLLIFALTISIGFYAPLLYAEDATIEYKIKAGYLYNFTKFVTWSSDNLTTFNLCILGDDPFGDLIDPIEEHTAFDKPIKLFRINQLNPRLQCHILYINKSFSENMDVNNSVFREHENTLIVGEGELFGNTLGIISFMSREGKIKLKINLKNLKKSALHVSAKLLEVAESTSREEENDQ